MKNIESDMAIQRMFRIQGGITPCRSREFLRVKDNKLECSKWRAVYIGDVEHMMHFLVKKRLGAKSIEQVPKDIKDYDLHVIEMYVPYWYTHLIEMYSVGQYNNGKTRSS